MRVFSVCIVFFLLSKSVISAEMPVPDGVLDVEFYGTPLAIQDTATSFGNATNSHSEWAIGGSELDAAYGRVADGYLWLFFAGNIESRGAGLSTVGGIPTGNRNKIDIFIDSIQGGQNGLRGDNVDVDDHALSNMGHVNSATNGLYFDADMFPDFYFTFNNYSRATSCYNPPSDQCDKWHGKLYYATLPSDGNGIAITFATFDDRTNPALAHGVKLGFNNSNSGGVWGTDHPDSENTDDATNVLTGLELGIPLTMLADSNGMLNSSFKITAFINNVYHRYLSNQILGPLGQNKGQYGNLGDPQLLDLSIPEIPGDQYFAVANPVTDSRTIKSVELSVDSEIHVTYITEVGQKYILEATPFLVNPVWSNASAVVTAETVLTEFISNPTTASNMFFRIQKDKPQ